jgi:PAS domain S-box-containing protein
VNRAGILPLSRLDRQFFRHLLGLSALAALCFVAGRQSLSLAFMHRGSLRAVSAVWLPSGIAVGAVLLYGRRLWPGIFAGSFILSLVTGFSLPVSALLALSAVAEALLAEYMLRYLGFDRRMERIVDVLAYVTMAAGLSAIAGATLSIAALAASGYVVPTALIPAWGVWWMGNMISTLILGSAILSWGRYPLSQVRGIDLRSCAIILAGLLVFTAGVYGSWLPREIGRGLTYIAFPIAIWATLSFGQRGTTTITFLLAAILTIATIRGLGPFAGETLYASLLQLNGFLTAATVTAMLLAAAIGERRRAEDALRENVAHLSALIENMRAGVLVEDDARRVLYVTPSFCRMFGLNPDPLPGTDAGDLTETIKSAFADPAALTRSVAECLAGGVAVSGETFNLANGRILDRDYVPIRIGEFHHAHMWIYRDITERVRLEEKLYHAQKMDAIGRLAGGIAHEVNNQLTVINGYSQLIEANTDPGSPLLDDIREIHRAGERAAGLTRQLLAFSRRQMNQPQVIDLNDTLQNMVKVLRRLIGEDTDLFLDLTPHIGRIKMDPGQIEQIIINLALNAREAMPEGGPITIATRPVRVTRDEPSEPEVHDGHFVCLSVTDVGVGIDEEARAHLFEPFYTTKEDGTGLGLAVIYGIVKQNNGWIDVSSQPGQGSTFEIYLPDVRETETEPVDAAVLPQAHGRGECILLVEDDESVCQLAARMLRRSGYDVCEANGVSEALQVYEQVQGHIAMVFSDVVLADGSGVHLVETLLKRDPSLRVLLTSGYADQKLQWSVIRAKGYRFLPKPYPLTDLLQTVQDILSPASAAE